MSNKTPCIPLDLAALAAKCRGYIQSLEASEANDAAHDLQHILRVVKSARALCAAENREQQGACNEEIVLPAAYLHDCVSLPKNHPQRHRSSEMAADQAIDFLASIDYPRDKLDAVHHAIMAHSFSAGLTPETLEAQVVQDADRLDALGAIGVTRCIQVGTALDRVFCAIEDPFCTTRTPDDSVYTLDHFYTKLLKLRETFQTEAGREEADRRIAFMQSYLSQLAAEIS